MSSNWKELLKSQQQSLKAMEELDAEMNNDQANLEADINNVLKYPSSRNYHPVVDRKRNDSISQSSGKSQIQDNDNMRNLNLDLRALSHNDNLDDEDNHPGLVSSRSESSPLKSPSNSALAKAPDTSARYSLYISQR
jgi:hypothetical protein